ncbi:Glycosyltransferase involved in cell wall bisynthesis [Klenkia soli]|uniref:Glycosyltransferase involved in cell wall bisynthesis n=1 Tax=Klenkia soli TaxID=1052260 RepID=A0A1H0MUQ8_9ACTN|nr:Glycosyltransferase involved in cell wall bisynthesis [Klenkia soli]
MAALVSADGAYGGPVSVATDQVAALRSAGHEVTLVAGRDAASRPDHPATRLFRARRPRADGFAGMVAPGVPAWVLRHARRYDVVHVHLTRDLVTLPAAWLADRLGVPVVVQTHGQVRAEHGRLQGVLDALWTRRLIGRSRFLALTGHEAADLQRQGVPADRVDRVVNGVPLAREVAAAPGAGPRVLFVSRLADRKRPVAFVQAAALVHAVRPDVRFELWGPDGGEAPAVDAAIAASGIAAVCARRGPTSPAGARELLAGGQLFVLPSVAEPFPMAVLEALGAGLPVVLTTETGLSAAVAEAGAGAVTDGSPQELADAVLRLLGPAAWQEAATAARELARSRYAMDVVVATLEETYRRAVTERRPG